MQRATMCEPMKWYSLGSDVHWETEIRITQVGEFWEPHRLFSLSHLVPWEHSPCVTPSRSSWQFIDLAHNADPFSVFNWKQSPCQPSWALTFSLLPHRMWTVSSTTPRTATEHKSAYANHSNVAVERVTRQLRACGTTQSISIPPCLLRSSGRCSNNVLVTNVPRNPHQQLLILRTATFFRGSTQQPFKKIKCML